MYVKTDRNNLVKDMSTGAILNVDTLGFQEYKAHRNKMISAFKASDEVNQLKAKIEKLENILDELINKTQSIGK
jgi:hypothetical protein